MELFQFIKNKRRILLRTLHVRLAEIEVVRQNLCANTPHLNAHVPQIVVLLSAIKFALSRHSTTQLLDTEFFWHLSNLKLLGSALVEHLNKT